MSRRLKSLLPSLLLIAVYFIADEFFGPVIGSLVAIFSGIIEFAYTRIREKTYDRTLLWTTLFFCLPGAIALMPANSTIARLQPAVIETCLCAWLGIFAFSRTDITAILPAEYRKSIRLSERQLKNMRQNIKLLFYLTTAHTLAFYYCLLFAPESVAGFVGSHLPYMLLGAFFLSLFLRNRFLSNRMKKEEWLPVVNEKGEVVGQAPRSLCHSGSRLLHPVVHLHILNRQREVFLQKRSTKKDLLPGIWDTAVGGHIGINETVEDALKRETREELGIRDFQARFIGNYLWESPREKELVFAFLCSKYDGIRIDNDEVDEGRFWSKKEIEEGIRNETVTPNFAHEYRLLLSKILS